MLTRSGLPLQRVSTLPAPHQLQSPQLQTKFKTVINRRMFAFSGLHKTKLHEAKHPFPYILTNYFNLEFPDAQDISGA